MTFRNPFRRYLWRVRHPLCPTKFVWYFEKTTSVDDKTGMGIEVQEIVFAQYRSGMTKAAAKRLAKAVGGRIEPITGPITKHASYKEELEMEYIG